MGIQLTASKGGSNLLPEGNYVASITDVELVHTDAEKHPWSDSCPQLKLALECEGAKIDFYQSLKGFKYEGDDLTEEVDNVSAARLTALKIKKADWLKKSVEDRINQLFTFEDADEYGSADRKYAVYRVGEKERVESSKRTQDCKSIAGRLGYHAGIAEEGEQFDTDSLSGAEIGIEIVHFRNKNGKTYMKVDKTMTVDAVTA